jgi:hypothetical protein
VPKSRISTAMLCATVAGLLSLGLTSGTANAVTATSKCQNVAAGYFPLSAGSGGGYAFDGRLSYNACVSIDSTGRRSASAELSSLYDVYRHDRFTGVQTAYLQGCYAKATYSDLVNSGSSGSYSGYDYGTLASGRYYFTRFFTGFSTSPAPYGFRVRVHTSHAVVLPRDGSPVLSLSKDGPTGNMDYVTGCFAI